MKTKYLFMAGIAAMMLFSCAKDEPIGNADESANTKAISFSSYFNQEVTTRPYLSSDGVGMFAFYQPGVNGQKSAFSPRKYTQPDFMYNQFVSTETGYYTPTKYWPNNTTDLVSFFAYSPYQSNKTWDDLGIYTDDQGYLYAPFVVSKNPYNQTDWLWADPQLNCYFGTESSEGTDIGRLVKSESSSILSGSLYNGFSAGQKVNFTFEHALSQIYFTAEKVIDGNHISDPYESGGGYLSGLTKATLLPGVLPEEAGAAVSESTTVTVNSITIKNIYEKAVRIYQGARSYHAVEFNSDDSDILTKEKGVATSIPYTCSGTQSITVDSDWLGIDLNYYYEESEGRKVTSAANAITKRAYHEPRYLYLAPQRFYNKDAEVVINYTVTTVDPVNPSNNSTVTNEITKSLYEDGGLEAFLPGHSYRLNFSIGLNSVNFSIDQTDWIYAQETELEVPKSEPAYMAFKNTSFETSYITLFVPEQKQQEDWGGGEQAAQAYDFNRLPSLEYSYDGETWYSFPTTVEQSEETPVVVDPQDERDVKEDGPQYGEGGSYSFGDMFTTLNTKSGSSARPTGISLAEGEKIYVRNKNEYYDSWDMPRMGSIETQGNDGLYTLRNSSGCHFYVSGGSVEVSGDIMSLLTKNMNCDYGIPDAAFSGLFMGSDGLVSAQNLLLPKTLNTGCFAGMFSGCSKLQYAPELPSTNLDDFCYYCMFTGCRSLITAPSLPASRMAYCCYFAMFANSSVTYAPELSATQLATGCYAHMFAGCTGLVGSVNTEVIELPALTLEPYCYNSMFRGCSNLHLVAMLATDYSCCEAGEGYNWSPFAYMLENAGADYPWSKSLYLPYSVRNLWMDVMDDECRDNLRCGFTLRFIGEAL